MLWSIYIAFKYAKLWADGYDWRDVFRQPRDRELIDVVDDTLDVRARDVRSRSRGRGCVRERAERRALARMGGAPALPSGMDASPPATTPRRRLAGQQRRPRSPGRAPIATRSSGASTRCRRRERERFPTSAVRRRRSPTRWSARGRRSTISTRHDVAGGARGARARDRRARERGESARATGSEERVRRLAYLKRQRRAIVDVAKTTRRGRGEARDLRRSRSRT